jgi:hypothetical protein
VNSGRLICFWEAGQYLREINDYLDKGEKMEKLDLKKAYKHLYNPSAKAPVLVQVPPLNFARIDGQIEAGCAPGTSPSFSAAISALYSVSYTLKFMLKKRPENPVDYPVMPLEAFWFTDTGEYDLSQPGGWKWTAQIMQPEVITSSLWDEAMAQVRKKKAEPALDLLRFECYDEGLSVQMLHIGPYKTEPETVAKMDAFQAEQGYRFRGPHHEIYLGDPMRADPAKLKTVLRHAVEPLN